MSRTSASAVSGSRCAVGSSSRSTGASDRRALRDRQALALAPGELRAFLADQRLEPVRGARRPSRRCGRDGGRPRAPRRSRRAGEAEVRPDRRVEDVGVLAGERERAPQVVLTELAHVATRKSHAAFVGIEEAEQEVRHGRLADAARPDERDLPARLEQQVESAERGLARRARSGRSLPRAPRPRGERRRKPGLGGIAHGGLAVDELEHAPAGRDRGRELPARRPVAVRRLERRQGEQREGRHEHAVERLRRRRPPRARRRPSGPRSGSRGPPRGPAVSASRRARRASSSLRARIRCERVGLTPVDDELRSAAQELDELGGELRPRGGLAATGGAAQRGRQQPGRVRRRGRARPRESPRRRAGTRR